jgi:periplasmic copper chaperone A
MTVPRSTEERSNQMRRITTPLIAVLVAAALPAAASAHVSLHPNEVPTGAYATLDLRVPNESDNANTVKIAVQLPSGFTDVSPEFMPGWTPRIRTVKLAKPVQSDDGPITEGVREIVWEGKGADGKIPPGQFLNFPISTEIPGKAGSTITFKVLQFYDDGEVARWIGPPSSDEPAPDIDVTAAGGPLQDVAGSEADAPTPGEEGSVNSKNLELEPRSTEASSSGGSSDKGLAIAALIVAAISLITAAVAVTKTRRKPA